MSDETSVDEFLDRVRGALPADPGFGLGVAERLALLDLARVAAHLSHRTAAPLTTFLAGRAFGALPPEERARRISALARTLEVGAPGS